MSKNIIYKEDAIEVVCRECHEFRGLFSRIEEGINELPSADTFEITKEALIEAIDNAKTVGDVVKNIINRPQGEWIDKGWHGDWQFEIDGRGNCWKEFECSNCNCHARHITPFCPQCGAKMEE